jgi:hypothetical protein
MIPMTTFKPQHMKTNLLMLFFALFAFMNVSAQGEDELESRRERIERMKRTFISERLNLTVAEAEKFWPVYNEYNDRKMAIRKELGKLNKQLKAATTEKEVNDGIAAISKKKQEDLANDEKFAKDVLPILGSQKTVTMMGLPQEFKKEVMERLRERRQQGGGGQGRGPR